MRSELEKQSQALLIVVPPKVNESYEAFSVDFGKAKTDVSVARTSFSLGAYESGLKEGRDACVRAAWTRRTKTATACAPSRFSPNEGRTRW